jgi:protein-S-isoprenylcysteine O-methyltransferase Ste14
MMRTLFIGLRALIFMTAFLWLWTWLLMGMRSLDRYFDWTAPGWFTYLAPVLVLPGAALVLASGGFFVVRGRGTPALFDPPRHFVASGPYRLVRNPMYVGALLLLAGLALYFGSPTLLVAVPLVFAIAHLLVILYEEPHLRRTFGAPYEDYCHAVHRWLPCAR